MSQQTRKRPITEARHPLTENIDIFSPKEIVGQLHRCDKEIFRGWENSKGVYSETVQSTVSDLIDETVEHMKDPHESLIVISGCGTSGRLAFITAVNFNERMARGGREIPSLFEYLIAGGDLAIFASQEQAEDIPQLGVKDLEKVTKGKKKVLLIGITCGLSAPYVAGQIDYALDHHEVFTPVVIGFNPVESARNLPIEGWDKTFYDVLKRLESAKRNQRGYILNPIIGPEPITGSSRMKSGTATKMILDTIFVSAIHRVEGHNIDVPTVFMCHELVQDKTYSYQAALGDLVEKGGACLNKGGHIYYSSAGSLGVMGILDASECPPTFGAEFDDIRGFVSGGFSCLSNKEGDLSHEVAISTEYFLRERLDRLTTNDIFILLTTGGTRGEDLEIIQKISNSDVFCVLVHIRTSEELYHDANCDQVLRVDLPWKEITGHLGEGFSQALRPHITQLSCKWLLNTISTGAHILKGKIYQNCMVDLNVSNTKLYHRAIGMIQDFAQVSQLKAEEALLKSIYQSDVLSEDVKALPIGQRIILAPNRQRVVPVALVIAATRQTFVEAVSALADSHILRIAISKCLHGNELQ